MADPKEAIPSKEDMSMSTFATASSRGRERIFAESLRPRRPLLDKGARLFCIRTAIEENLSAT